MTEKPQKEESCDFCHTDKPVHICAICTQRMMTALNLVPREMVAAPTKKDLRDADA